MAAPSISPLALAFTLAFALASLVALSCLSKIATRSAFTPLQGKGTGKGKGKGAAKAKGQGKGKVEGKGKGESQGQSLDRSVQAAPSWLCQVQAEAGLHTILPQEVEHH